LRFAQVIGCLAQVFAAVLRAQVFDEERVDPRERHLQNQMKQTQIN
jgi:hypothetical protein